MKTMSWVMMLMVMMLAAGTALAQDAEAPADEEAVAAAREEVSHTPVAGEFLKYLHIETLGALLGAGMIVLGAAKGIGNIAGKAVESIARQPEAGNRIFTSMIVAAALIEGFTFFGLVIALLAAIK